MNLSKNELWYLLAFLQKEEESYFKCATDEIINSHLELINTIINKIRFTLHPPE